MGGEELIVDPGTFSYFTSTTQRKSIVSSHRHNLSVIEDCEPAKQLGTFSFEQVVDIATLQFNRGKGMFLVPGPVIGTSRFDYQRLI